jgi:tetratricopeptide (TPR) repeat protein
MIMRGSFLTFAASAFALAICAASPTTSAQSQQFVGDCGNPFENAYGPYDYRTATAAQKSIVEVNHFTSLVESLQGGITGTIGGEIDYTLRAFPNHPRALMAMIRLGQRDKTNKPRGAHYTVECYIDRANRYQPDDMGVRQIRGIYYSMNRKYDLAIADFAEVIEQAPDNANAHYNLGLAYFETRQYDKALEEARKAKSLGFPLEGLKHMLTSAGKWQD